MHGVFRNVAVLSAAGAVIASPIQQRQPTSLVIQVTLSNSASAASELYSAPANSTAMSVASTTTYDSVHIQCAEICIPEFHCTLYDKSNATITDVNPGNTALDNVQVGQVACESGLSEDAAGGSSSFGKKTRTLRRGTTSTTTRTTTDNSSFDGEAVFTDASTGAQSKVGFMVGQTATVGDGTANMSAATVDKTSLTNTDTAPAFTCVAHDAAGASLGTFFGTERYSYTFVPSVVASFLCSTGS